jgi:hypothetical protein
MTWYRASILATVLALAVAPVAADTLVEKAPDLGAFWQPLNPNTGSYAYADCFVAPAAPDTVPDTLGTWLLDLTILGNPGTGTNSTTGASAPTGVPPTIRFEIWGDAAGPNAGDILATTGSLSPAPVLLDFISAPVLPGATSLTPGNLYWFVATVVGETGTGSYQTGGHTQNSTYPDNCTFWFSNDPAGINFDGQGLTPEMAFSVNLTGPIPVELTGFEVE